MLHKQGHFEDVWLSDQKSGNPLRDPMKSLVRSLYPFRRGAEFLVSCACTLCKSRSCCHAAGPTSDCWHKRQVLGHLLPKILVWSGIQNACQTTNRQFGDILHGYKKRLHGMGILRLLWYSNYISKFAQYSPDSQMPKKPTGLNLTPSMKYPCPSNMHCHFPLMVSQIRGVKSEPERTHRPS